MPYYVRPLSRATLSFQASIEDLNLYKMLLTTTKEHNTEGFQQLSQAVVGKLENHFWYLTECLVVLSLLAMLVFSKNKVWLES